MDSVLKLVLVVLGFFLALTYVDGSGILGNDSVVFNGKNPVSYDITILNSSNHTVVPEFWAEGPFTINWENESGAIPSFGEKTFTLILSPLEKMEKGDSYVGTIRVTGLETPVDKRIIFFKDEERINAGEQITSAFSGLVVLAGGNEEIILNVFLFMAVLVLAVALASRIKNRL